MRKAIRWVGLLVCFFAIFLFLFPGCGKEQENKPSPPSVEEVEATNQEDTESQKSNERPYYDAVALAHTSTISVGDLLFFGSFEQDGDRENGPEAIEWIVIDENEDNILIISKYCLDCFYYGDDTGVAWEDSALREWLNSAFYDAAFSDTDREIIMPSFVNNGNTPTGNDDPGSTEDAVYILSANEAIQYFDTADKRTAQATRYAVDHSIYVSEDNGNTPWLLRTPGVNNQYVAYVYSWGEINYDGDPVSASTDGIRPVIRLKADSREALENLSFEYSQNRYDHNVDGNNNSDTADTVVEDVKSAPDADMSLENAKQQLIGQWDSTAIEDGYTILRSLSISDDGTAELMVGMANSDAISTYEGRYAIISTDIDGKQLVEFDIVGGPVILGDGRDDHYYDASYDIAVYQESNDLMDFSYHAGDQIPGFEGGYSFGRSIAEEANTPAVSDDEFLEVLREAVLDRMVNADDYSYEELVDKELSQIEGYMNAEFSDPQLSSMANKYIEGVILQEDAIHNDEIDEITWQEGKVKRYEALSDLYYSYDFCADNQRFVESYVYTLDQERAHLRELQNEYGYVYVGSDNYARSLFGWSLCDVYFDAESMITESQQAFFTETGLMDHFVGHMYFPQEDTVVYSLQYDDTERSVTLGDLACAKYYFDESGLPVKMIAADGTTNYYEWISDYEMQLLIETAGSVSILEFDEDYRITRQTTFDQNGDPIQHFEYYYVEDEFQDPADNTEQSKGENGITQDEALLIACDYWDIYPGDYDEETGYKFSVSIFENTIEFMGRPCFEADLRWLVVDHYSRLDYIYIDAETGECYSPFQ